MNKDLESLDWSPLYKCRNVNEAWAQIKEALTTVFEHHAPKICKHIKGKPVPWLNPAVKKLMNERDKLLRKCRKTKTDLDISQYKQKRNEVNIALRKAKSTYSKNLLSESSNNPNKFWKAIKSIYPSKANMGTSLHSFDFQDGKTNEPKRVADGFCNFFASIVTTLRKTTTPLYNFVWMPPTPIPNRTKCKFKFRPVSRLEVEQDLKSIKRGKSTGTDNLPPGLLKDASCRISAPLAYLINLSLQTGTFPTDWKQAKIVPIHKSGSLNSFDNFRPISIPPVLSKMIEKAVHRQVMAFLEAKKLISQSQFGFRPKLSTELAATFLFDNIRQHVDEGNLVGATFIDLSKAFDTISHSNLLKKLPQYGICDKELRWFTDYLFHRSMVVSYGSCLSSKREILTGVPQGSILGPLLFILFFNDITDVVDTAKIVIYADDSVVYVADKDVKNINSKLTKEMDAIAKWFDKNVLIINLRKGKTESLLFVTSQRIAKQDSELNVMYRGVKILNTSQYKYLGIEVDSTLNLNCHFEKCYKRASSRLRLLGKLRRHLDMAAAKAIYRTMILPTFTFSGILLLKLTETQVKRLSTFHDRSRRIVLGDSGNCDEIQSVVNANKIRACKLVRKCIDKDICDAFQGYFNINDHTVRTRNHQSLLKIPKIKTEFARKSFRFMGATIYNELPIQVRRIESFIAYEQSLNQHFS